MPFDQEICGSLVEAGQKLVELGLSPGSSGNLSMRAGERIFVSPSGVALNGLSEEEISAVSLDGSWLSGPRPSKEASLHAALYLMNTTAAAVVHVHSAAAVAVSCLPPWSTWTALPPYTPYPLMVAGQVPLVEYAAPGSDRLVDNVDRVDVPFSAALLANHGSVAAAASLSQAISMLVEIEQACALTLQLAGKDARLLTPNQIEELCEKYGTFWTPQ